MQNAQQHMRWTEIQMDTVIQTDFFLITSQPHAASLMKLFFLCMAGNINEYLIFVYFNSELAAGWSY